MPSHPFASLAPMAPADSIPFTLDDLALLFIATTRMLEDRDPFTQERYAIIGGLHDRVKEHASQLAGRRVTSAELVGWFRTVGA